nr:YccS family putative transporter [uncultured Xylophilus sp.]
MWARDTFVYSLRVLIALSAVMALWWTRDRMAFVMPTFLGIIASALAETDDSWRGRLRALLATLGCFAAAALAVQMLYAHGIALAAMLVAAAFVLTMLGAVGERYRAIASATLILALYGAIGMEHFAATGAPFWQEPALLLLGAAWYGLLSVAWAAVFVHQPVQQNLARLYTLLGEYLWLKSALFEPVRGIDVERRRIGLARHNATLVAALNTTKESLYRRTDTPGSRTGSRRLRRYLALYFLAQDVHERASASHAAYGEMTDAFFHSDVMYRCQRLLALQGTACQQLARAIQLRRPFDGGSGDRQQAAADLRDAIAHLQTQTAGRTPARERLLRSLVALEGNLAALDMRLTGATRPAALDDPRSDRSLFDRSAHGWREALARVRLQLTPQAAVFRHAVRLSLALAAGFAVQQVLQLDQGWWILLTTLFVCQPSYGETLRRVVQRVTGTLGGLVVGWALFDLFPDLRMQSVVAVAAGVVFFATRRTRYTVATGAITLLVLLSFNQIGNGYDLIVPRLVDTVIGAAIAGAAVFLVLPDWRSRRLEQVASAALAASGRYLQQILEQYRTGKRDDLAYRLARRNAHNADAALSSALSGMLQEPGFLRDSAESGIRFLLQSHTLLNYLSALGAHRRDGGASAATPEIDTAADLLPGAIARMAERLAARQAPETTDDAALAALADALDAAAAADSAEDRARRQLALVCRQLPAIGEGIRRLLATAALPATLTETTP